jgi:cobalt/nickel transport system ATP-binding protein
MTAIIAIQDLSFSYPDGKLALENIDLQIYPGEKVALVGANGAGKSTLLLQLNGIFQGSGLIKVNDLLVEKKSLKQIRAWVGMVFQNPDDQLFSTTVFDDVAYGPIYQGLDQLSVQKKVRKALQAVHMSGYEHRPPFHLSSGEKKRIAIAAVLSMDPQILVFDEPTSGLDPRSRRELIELLQELPQTMVIATHDLELVKVLTPRVVILHQGRIVADGVTNELMQDEALLFANGLS